MEVRDLEAAMRDLGINMPVFGLPETERHDLESDTPCVVIGLKETWNAMCSHHLFGLKPLWVICVGTEDDDVEWGDKFPKTTSTIRVSSSDWDLTVAAGLAADIKEYTPVALGLA